MKSWVWQSYVDAVNNNKDQTELPLGKSYDDHVWLGDYDHSPSNNTKKGCQHEWVNVGFHHDKWVCKKCNKDQGDF
jgi:hypothetical protein